MTAKPQSVRLATQEDEDQIFDLLCQLHAENAMFSKDDEKVLFFIRKATRQDGGIMGVIEKDGKIVACIGMFLDQFWFSSDWYLSEYFCFVHPDHRKGTTFAKDLIQFAKWSRENLGLILIIGIMSSIRTKAKMFLYNKNLQFIGGIFTDGVQGDDYREIEMPERYSYDFIKKPSVVN